MPAIVRPGELVVCHCLHVGECELRNAISIGGCRSLGEVRDCTGAGSGCTACHCRIVELLREENLLPAAQDPQAEDCEDLHSDAPAPICA